MVLRSRKGNSFEMATLLCSILIGFGFPAMVVSGYATREVTTNDQRRVKCPYIPEDKIEDVVEEELDAKYRLKDPPFLKSRFLIQCEQKESDANNEVLAEKMREEELKLEELERPELDPEHGFRIHSWVVMTKNSPWCFKPEFVTPEIEEDDEDQENVEPKAFFIEPSTGFMHELTDINYLGIESIWNHQNYYVNLQYPNTPIHEMKWDLSDSQKWEHFLPGEPFELRKEKKPDDEDEDQPTENQILAIEKHLDMSFSWVDMLHISAVDFEERYFNGEKKEHYKYVILEKFAPYKNVDGLMKRLTIYKTLDYEHPLHIYEWYENREDFMKTIQHNCFTTEIIEEFDKGRVDCLKTFIHYPDETREVVLKFFSKSRFDCMKQAIFHSSYIAEFYDERRRDL